MHPRVRVLGLDNLTAPKCLGRFGLSVEPNWAKGILEKPWYYSNTGSNSWLVWHLFAKLTPYNDVLCFVNGMLPREEEWV